jgi:hypothetical protein
MSVIVNLRRWDATNIYHPTEAEWLRLYRSMTEDQRDKARARLEAMLERRKAEIGAVR